MERNVDTPCSKKFQVDQGKYFNPVLGVIALVFDGFLSGLAISPLMFVAACMITALVFVGISGYIVMQDALSQRRAASWSCR